MLRRACGSAALCAAAAMVLLPSPASAMWGRLKKDHNYTVYGNTIHHSAGTLVHIGNDWKDKWIIATFPTWDVISKSDVEPIPEYAFTTLQYATATHPITLRQWNGLAEVPALDHINGWKHTPVKTGETLEVMSKTMGLYHVQLHSPCCTNGYVKAEDIKFAPGSDLRTTEVVPAPPDDVDVKNESIRQSPEYQASLQKQGAAIVAVQRTIWLLIGTPIIAFLWVFVGTKIAGSPQRRARLWEKRRHRYVFVEATGSWYPVTARTLTGGVQYKPQADTRSKRESRELDVFKHRLWMIPLVFGGGTAMLLAMNYFGAKASDPMMLMVDATMLLFAILEVCSLVFGVGMVLDPPGRAWQATGQPFGPESIAAATTQAGPQKSASPQAAAPVRADDGLTYRPKS